MYLGLNTMLCEAAGRGCRGILQTASDCGFKYLDVAFYERFVPGIASAADLRDAARMFKDMGLVSSQSTLLNTIDIASSDASKRAKAQDFMRRATEYTLELGGHQVLICWGGGLVETGRPYAESWMLSVEAIRSFVEWCKPLGVYAGMELDPHVYFILNNMGKLTAMVEDVGLDNLYPNIDIGHLAITRESPACLEKAARRIYHVHISETDSFAHTNSIIGTGIADIPPYVAACREYGFVENCARIGEVPVLAIEMAEPGMNVPDPERWIRESLDYLARVLPGVKQS